jgi:hypothetical protein
MVSNVTEAHGWRRTLVLASITHALHDGFTDMIYVLLPVWQAEFSLDYVALASGSDAGLSAAFEHVG